MNALTETQHDEIAELLPDFAIGALSDGDLWRVEAHLDTCPRCQAEFARVLDVVSVIAPVSPPSAATKRALFERAGYPLPEPVSPPGDHSAEPIPLHSPARSAKVRTFPSRLAWIALPAAAIALFLLGGWNLWLQQELDDQQDLAALIAEPGTAYQLDDTGVETDASAVVYVDPQRDRALLTARNLPLLVDARRYQIWLFTEDGQRVSAGSFAPDDDGSVVAVVESPEPFMSYWAVAISAEPQAGSDAPTSPLFLGGWIQ